MDIKTFYDAQTATFTHVVSDPRSGEAMVVDAVLDLDMPSGRISTQSLDRVIAYLEQNRLTLSWIVETHVHADHISGASELQARLGGQMGISAKVTEVLAHWVPIFNSHQDTPLDGSQFDVLFEDGDSFALGELAVHVLATPGHTPACVSYKVGDAVFVGDTIFMPDVGTARTDFPGGDAGELYDSIMRLLDLPENTCMMMCHDYPPANRDVAWVATVGEQKQRNILVGQGVSRQAFIERRQAKDAGKAPPTLLLPSIQTNLRGGSLGNKESNGLNYIKIPIGLL